MVRCSKMPAPSGRAHQAEMPDSEPAGPLGPVVVQVHAQLWERARRAGVRWGWPSAVPTAWMPWPNGGPQLGVGVEVSEADTLRLRLARDGPPGSPSLN